MKKCKHEVENRQGVASASGQYLSSQIVSVICLKCGKILYTSMINRDSLNKGINKNVY